MKLREHSVKINGLFRPVIDTVPKFSWKLIADKNGESQSAYRLVVSASPDFANPVWDTGFVPSHESVGISYGGSALAPMTRYYLSLEIRAGKDRLVCNTEYFDTGKRGHALCRHLDNRA